MNVIAGRVIASTILPAWLRTWIKKTAVTAYCHHWISARAMIRIFNAFCLKDA